MADVLRGVSVVERILREDPPASTRWTSRAATGTATPSRSIAQRCRSPRSSVAERWSLAADALAHDADRQRSRARRLLPRERRPLRVRAARRVPSARPRAALPRPARAPGLVYWGMLTVITLLLAALGCVGSSASRQRLGVARAHRARARPALRGRAHVEPARALRSVPPRCCRSSTSAQPVADAHRTLVVVPALLSSVASHAVCDRQPGDRATSRTADPNVALRAARRPAGARRTDSPGRRDRRGGRSRHRELNDRYGPNTACARSTCSSAAATYNESEQTWMGWERKRGALIEFCAAPRRDRHLVRRRSSATTIPRRHLRDHARHRHAPATRRRAQAHLHDRSPAQPRALASRAHARVRRGYGLVQPRVAMSLRARRTAGSRGCTRESPASTRTPARYPTRTRTSSARDRSPARASSRSTSSDACSATGSPRTRCSRTT